MCGNRCLWKAVTNTHRTKEADRLVMDGLFTTNCIMPPRESYQDRVYTTSVVGYEGLKYIERKKDIFIYSVFYMFEDIKKVFDIDKKSMNKE